MLGAEWGQLGSYWDNFKGPGRKILPTPEPWRTSSCWRGVGGEMGGCSWEAPALALTLQHSPNPNPNLAIVLSLNPFAPILVWPRLWEAQSLGSVYWSWRERLEPRPLRGWSPSGSVPSLPHLLCRMPATPPLPQQPGLFCSSNVYTEITLSTQRSHRSTP